MDWGTSRLRPAGRPACVSGTFRRSISAAAGGRSTTSNGMAPTGKSKRWAGPGGGCRKEPEASGKLCRSRIEAETEGSPGNTLRASSKRMFSSDWVNSEYGSRAPGWGG